jgi:hypothetical protein
MIRSLRVPAHERPFHGGTRYQVLESRLYEGTGSFAIL